MKIGRTAIMLIYASIALIVIWLGAGWIISEATKLYSPQPAVDIFGEYNEFRLLYGVSMVLIGAYIMLKNIIFRDTILY